MFGLIVGTLCLLALIATLRRRRYYAYRAVFGHHYGLWGYGRRGGRPRQLVHMLFAQLDTTPGQEKAIVAGLETLRERMAGTRRELDAVCRELAVIVGGAVFDQGAYDAVKARADDLYGRFSADLRGLLELVHDTLDADQRRKFAELIHDGSLFHAYCEQPGGFAYTQRHGYGPHPWAYGHGYGC
jgi:hypothetical protein